MNITRSFNGSAKMVLLIKLGLTDCFTLRPTDQTIFMVVGEITDTMVPTIVLESGASVVMNAKQLKELQVCKVEINISAKLPSA